MEPSSEFLHSHTHLSPRVGVISFSCPLIHLPSLYQDGDYTGYRLVESTIVHVKLQKDLQHPESLVWHVSVPIDGEPNRNVGCGFQRMLTFMMACMQVDRETFVSSMFFDIVKRKHIYSFQ